MSQLDPLKTFAQLTFGKRVDKTAEEVTSATPTATVQSLFTIAGGRVLVTAIIGEITVAASGAITLQLNSNPTTGTSAVLDTALTATSLEARTILSNVGAVGSALSGVSAGVAVGPTIPIIVPVGAIELLAVGSSTTITTKWSIFYVPLDAGASITAAN